MIRVTRNLRSLHHELAAAEQGRAIGCRMTQRFLLRHLTDRDLRKWVASLGTTECDLIFRRLADGLAIDAACADTCADTVAEVLRAVDQARTGPHVTCPASRHVHQIAEALAKGEPYPMLQEDPQHCAESMLIVLQSLWMLREMHKDKR